VGSWWMREWGAGGVLKSLSNEIAPNQEFI
jgi:hypothetical protein